VGAWQGLPRDHAPARRVRFRGAAEPGLRGRAFRPPRPGTRRGELRCPRMEPDRRSRPVGQADRPQAEPDPPLEPRRRRARRNGGQRDHPRRDHPRRRGLRDDRRWPRRQRRHRRGAADGLRLREDPRDHGARRDRPRLRRGDRAPPRGDRSAPGSRRLQGRHHRRAQGTPGRSGGLPRGRPRRAQLLHGLWSRPEPLPRRRLRPGPDRRAPQWRPQRLSPVRDRALRRSRDQPAEAQDPQEDGGHPRAQEPRRDQRRQELAAPSQPGLGRRRRRRVSAEFADRPPPQPRDRGRSSAPREGQGAQGLPDGAARGDGRPRRPVHSFRQLVRQPDDLAHVLRPESLPLLQRQGRPPPRPRRSGSDRPHADRRRARGRGRGPARPRRRAARCGDRLGRSRRGRPRGDPADGLRRAASRRRSRPDGRRGRAHHGRSKRGRRDGRRVCGRRRRRRGQDPRRHHRGLSFRGARRLDRTRRAGCGRRILAAKSLLRPSGRGRSSSGTSTRSCRPGPRRWRWTSRASRCSARRAAVRIS